MAIKNVINNIISNKNTNTACMLFGLVISLAFVQLYQSNYINHATHIKEAYKNQDIIDSNANILAELNSLKDVETDLYLTLDQVYLNSPTNTTLINTYINKIGGIQTLRVNLYKSLINNYEIYQNNIIDTRNNAGIINDAVEIINNNLPDVNALEDENINNKRYVEVNTYYANRYSYLTDIVKIIIYICIAMLILSSLANNSLIPEWLYSWGLVILLVVGLYFLGTKIILLFNVDNMNFNRLDWHFTPPTIDIAAVASPPASPPVST
jgi:hypothetical protein